MADHIKEYGKIRRLNKTIYIGFNDSGECYYNLSGKIGSGYYRLESLLKLINVKPSEVES